MTRILLLFFSALSLSLSANSQTSDPTIISSAGGSALTSTFIIDWTLGEYAVETISSPNKIFTQGFHQPLKIIATVVPATKTDVVYNITVAPNPVLSILNFSITSKNNVRVYVTISNIQGETLIQREVNSAAGNLQINMQRLPAGTYILVARDGVTAQIIKTYRIIKE